MKGDTQKQLERMIRMVEDACKTCNLMYRLCSRDPERSNEIAAITLLQDQLLSHLNELIEEIAGPSLTCNTGYLQFENSISIFLSSLNISRPGLYVHDDQDQSLIRQETNHKP